MSPMTMTKFLFIGISWRTFLLSATTSCVAYINISRCRLSRFTNCVSSNGLCRVASNERVNRMTKVNLAIVFGPGLGDNASTLGLSQNLGDYQQIVRLFIGHVDTIFPRRDFLPADTAHAVDASPDEQSPSPDSLLAPEGRSPSGVDSPRSPFAPRKSLEEFRGVVSQSAAIG